LFDLNPDAIFQKKFPSKWLLYNFQVSEADGWLVFLQITPRRAIPPPGKKLDKRVDIKSDISKDMRLTKYWQIY
jgi:hypothetical protein